MRREFVFLEEYIILTSVQPASLPARPHTFYHPPFFIFREGCEKLEDAIHETSNPFTMGAQTDILRRQVTNNPDRLSTYPSACLPACPPTSASFQQFSKRTPSDLDCTLTRCLCHVLTHLGSAIDAIDDYVQAAAKQNRASNGDNTTGTQSTLSRLTTGTKSKVTQSTRENNTAGPSPNVRDGMKRSLSLSPNVRDGIKRSLSLSPKIAQSKGGHGGTLKQSGALFAESQMPSSGDLTVEDDREVIREIEAKVMQTFVHFAVLCQCTLVELLDSNPPGRSLKTLTFTLHGKQFGRSLVDIDVLTAQLFTRDFTKKLVSLDLSRNLLNPESTEAIMKEVSLLYEPTLPNSQIPTTPQSSHQGRRRRGHDRDPTLPY